MADELGASRRGGRRSGRRTAYVTAVVATCLLGLALAPSGAASEPVTTTAEVDLSCTATTPEGRAAMGSLGLATLSIEVSQHAPASVGLGDAAQVEVGLSFDLGDDLAGGAEGTGIESVDLSGTSAQLRLIGPSGEQSAAATPPSPVIDPRVAGAVDLGGATFDLPTSQPGAAAVVIAAADVSVHTRPDGLAFTAACTAPAVPATAYTFVVDPSGPSIATPEAEQVTEARSGAVDLSDDVSAPEGTTLTGWRIVRTLGGGDATLDDGRLSWSLDEGADALDVVWEVCAVEGAAATTTTADPTTTTAPTTTPSVAADAPAAPGGPRVHLHHRSARRSARRCSRDDHHGPRRRPRSPLRPRGGEGALEAPQRGVERHRRLDRWRVSGFSGADHLHGLEQGARVEQLLDRRGEHLGVPVDLRVGGHRRHERHVVERREQDAAVEAVEVEEGVQVVVDGRRRLAAVAGRWAEPVLGPAAEALHRPGEAGPPDHG
jgi:hypothetical protein